MVLICQTDNENVETYRIFYSDMKKNGIMYLLGVNE